MAVELLYFDGCPNWQLVREHLRQALVRVGRGDAPVLLRPVESQEKAERLGFRGSPTILIEGEDPFADPDAEPGLSCRVYRTEDGSAGAPTVAQLVEALQ